MPHVVPAFHKSNVNEFGKMFVNAVVERREFSFHCSLLTAISLGSRGLTSSCPYGASIQIAYVECIFGD